MKEIFIIINTSIICTIVTLFIFVKIPFKKKALNTYFEVNKGISGITVTTPSFGMVIYKKDRNGVKRKTGSTINPIDRLIATLPDLSIMISKTCNDEIDISKIKTGQMD